LNSMGTLPSANNEQVAPSPWTGIPESGNGDLGKRSITILGSCKNTERRNRIS
jgi:hypothetical protein